MSKQTDAELKEAFGFNDEQTEQVKAFARDSYEIHNWIAYHNREVAMLKDSPVEYRWDDVEWVAPLYALHAAKSYKCIVVPNPEECTCFTHMQGRVCRIKGELYVIVAIEAQATNPVPRDVFIGVVVKPFPT